MKNITKKNVFFIIILIAGLALLVSRPTQKPVDVPKPANPVAEPESAPATNVTSDPEVTRDRVNPNDHSPIAAEGPVRPADPFCIEGKRDFVILPSVYLRLFYTNDQVWAALPEVYADCFREGESKKVYFFEFSGQYQLPVKPLVQAMVVVKTRKGFKDFPEFQKAHPELMNLKFNDKKNLGTAIRDEFNFKLSEPWVYFTMSKQNIEPHPAYWPWAPQIHPWAKVIQAKEISGWIKQSRDLMIVDVRSKAQREKFALPYEALTFRHSNKEFHHSILNPNEVTQLKLFKGENAVDEKDLNGTFILIGAHNNDYGTFNAANWLSIYGQRNVLIVDGGANALGGPPPKDPTKNFTEMTPQQLHSSFSESKRSSLLVDCRDPIHANNTIGSAERVMRKQKDQKTEYDLAPVLEKIKNQSTKSIILFGTNDLDGCIEPVGEILSRSGAPVYRLATGFQGWVFYKKYVFEISPALRLDKKPRGLRRSEPPQRIKRLSSKETQVVIKPEGGPHSVKPAPITKEDLESLKVKHKKKKSNSTEPNRGH